jgi:hypothetical protein
MKKKNIFLLILLFTLSVNAQNQSEFCKTFTKNVRSENPNFKKSYVVSENNCFIQKMYVEELALDSKNNYHTTSQESKDPEYIEVLTQMTLKSYNENGVSDALIKNKFSEFKIILKYKDNSVIKSNKYNIISGKKVYEPTKKYNTTESYVKVKKEKTDLDKIYKDIKETYTKIQNHSNKDKLKLIFKEWEIIMINDSIFDYVSNENCLNKNKMTKMYESKKYPMISDSQTVANVDYNNDGINDYIINYSLNNCVGGIGRGSYTDDFIFIKGKKNGELEIDRNFTNYFKRKMIFLYQKKFNVTSKINKNGFTHIPNISFYNIKKGIINGEMFLELNNYYPSKGKFTFSFIKDDFLIFDSYENLGIE